MSVGATHVRRGETLLHSQICYLVPLRKNIYNSYLEGEIEIPRSPTDAEPEHGVFGICGRRSVYRR